MPCPLCYDTGWKPAEVNGNGRVAADAHGPVSPVRVVRCDCWRQNVAGQRLAGANIPKRYQHCTIANFAAYNESLERAAAQARRLAETFPASGKGLLLEGQPGVGKT